MSVLYHMNNDDYLRDAPAEILNYILQEKAGYINKNVPQNFFQWNLANYKLLVPKILGYIYSNFQSQ